MYSARVYDVHVHGIFMKCLYNHCAKAHTCTCTCTCVYFGQILLIVCKNSADDKNARVIQPTGSGWSPMTVRKLFCPPCGMSAAVRTFTNPGNCCKIQVHQNKYITMYNYMYM